MAIRIDFCSCIYQLTSLEEKSWKFKLGINYSHHTTIRNKETSRNFTKIYEFNDFENFKQIVLILVF